MKSFRYKNDFFPPLEHKMLSVSQMLLCTQKSFLVKIKKLSVREEEQLISLSLRDERKK